MESGTSRYIVPPDYGDEGSIKEAFKIIKEISWKHGRSKEVTLFIPTLRDLDEIGNAASLDEKDRNKLSRGEKVVINIILSDELILQCKTMKNFKPTLSDKTILCIYPIKNMLDKVDSVENLELAVVVPCLDMEEVEGWRIAWNPKVSGEPNNRPNELIDNPVVEEAMKRLTARINLSNGLSDSRYKEKTVEILRRLRDNNENYDPDSLKGWALKNGWKPKDAEKLRVFAQGVIDRKPIRGNKDAWESNIISEIRKELSSK